MNAFFGYEVEMNIFVKKVSRTNVGNFINHKEEYNEKGNSSSINGPAPGEASERLRDRG